MNKFISFNNYLLNESAKYLDNLTDRLVKDVFRFWVEEYKTYREKKIEYIEFIDENKVKFNLECVIHFKKSLNGRKIPGFEIVDTTGFYSDEDTTTPSILIEFAINPEWLPGFWSEIYMYLADTMRHEIEHITQDKNVLSNFMAGKPNEDDSLMRELINNKHLPYYIYYTLPKEVDANIFGLKYEAKKRKEPMKFTIDKFLENTGISNKEKEEVLVVWRKRAKELNINDNF